MGDLTEKAASATQRPQKSGLRRTGGIEQKPLTMLAVADFC
jgi:hypothetical protein